MDYKTSGVDIKAGYEFVERLKLKVPTIGGFGGMFKVPRGYEEPILAVSYTHLTLPTSDLV